MQVLRRLGVKPLKAPPANSTYADRAIFTMVDQQKVV